MSVYVVLYAVTIWIVVSSFILFPHEVNHFALIRAIIVLFATTLLIKYFVYMFISPWNDVLMSFKRFRIRHRQPKSVYAPRVSVLVPAWNEEDGIVTTIETLLQSTYKNMEIIVINNASTDQTEEHVQAIIHRIAIQKIRRSRIDIVYVREENQGKGYALNKGIQIATGEILISIDADCSVSPTAIQNFVNCFEDPNVMAAVGNVKIGNTDTLIGVIQYLEFLFSFYFKKCDSIFGSIYIIGGAAGAFRKEVFTILEGYSVSNVTEDIDLSVRMQCLGMKIVYAQDAIIYTEGAADFSGLIKQRTRWKRGRFETFIQYRKLFFSTKKEHNKFLSWIVLPLAIFGDAQLFLELFFIAFLFVYSYLTNDYSSFISGIVIVSAMFAAQIVSDMGKQRMSAFILLAPIGWILLYAISFVEFQALVQSLGEFALGKKATWQSWNRHGVFVKQQDHSN